MPIVDARAIQYNQMINYLQRNPVEIHAEGEKGTIQQHDKVNIISITDADQVALPRIFTEDTDDVCTLVYDDTEPSGLVSITDFEPHPPYMLRSDAKRIVAFIERVHARPERVLMLVNCKFGMARSGAVVDFIGMTCNLGYWNTRNRNPQIIPNHWNSYLLMEEHFRLLQEKKTL
jgi:protein-tyrosine phosphatase